MGQVSRQWLKSLSALVQNTEFWGIEKSVAVMDGDGSQMLRGRMGTETMSDGDGWGWIQLLR